MKWIGGEIGTLKSMLLRKDGMYQKGELLGGKSKTEHLFSIDHFNYNPLQQAAGISVAPEETFISGGKLG